MSFKPNTTVYLCSGTGLDTSNSVFMMKYAYPDEPVPEAIKWWSALFQWFKAHSIAEGYWCYSFTDPSRGYIDVGRTPLGTGSKGQSGLGNAAKQAELDSNQDYYSEAIRAIDWVVFSNGVDEYSQDITYCMVDRIDYINFNTARIHFTVDALLTYQKYFWLGRCFVDRDMQFNEWNSGDVSRETQTPTLENINTQPEASGVSDSDYVLQHMVTDSKNQETLEALNFGAYNQMFCSSDIDLQTVRASASSAAIPQFDPSESTKVGNVELGIGVYRYTQRKNEAFTKLGSFNAMEHLLSCYMLPEKAVASQSDPIKYIANLDDIIDGNYRFGKDFLLYFPNWFTDDKTISQDYEPANKYKPLNFKCFTAPYTYMSVSDKQGSSLEILPQLLTKVAAVPTANNFFALSMKTRLSAAPAMPSNLLINNLINGQGSEENPFMTIWQFASYAMTPNGSGYNQTYANNLANAQAQTKMFIATATLASIAMAAANVLTGHGYDTDTARKMAGAVTGAAITQGAKAAGAYISAEETRQSNIQYGLPKSVGGLTNTLTSYNMNNAGYEFYWCHLRTDLLKIVDYMFSIIGYTQNTFRYPHINTRKRWCYVKLKTVNLRPQQANNYDLGGLPSWAKVQIETRLKNGVTFWNLRHAMGDAAILDYASMPSDIIKMGFIRNYGSSIDSEEMRDNTDKCDGYASDYSDEVLN